MKNKILLFLILLSSISFAQVSNGGEQEFDYGIKNNASTEIATPPFLVSQGIDGTYGKMNRDNVIEYLEFASAVNLPVTGEQGKLYLTKDNNKIYRWNGTYYAELAITDISGKVDKIVGKGLSTEDYTTPEKTKLAELFNYDPTTINNAIALKVDKVTGKSLIDDAEIARLATLDNYTHPANHPPSIITQDASNRFVTDAEKTAWNAKQGALGFTPENVSNKQNSLAVDGTNTKYPTVTAVNTGLDLKANLASPAFTGTPTAPTATAGTNTTQIANTAFVVSAINTANFNIVTTNTPQEIIAGKTFKSSLSTSEIIQVKTSGNAKGIRIIGNSNGDNIQSSQLGNGFVYVGQNNGTNTYTVDKLGTITGTKLINSTAPATNILLAGGGDIAQNTAFNKPFGITAGTVAEGNDSRINNGQTAFGWGNHSGLYPTYNGTGASGTWGINISGNAANSTLWNGYDISVASTNDVPSGILGFYNSGVTFKRSSATALSSFLGLGSNAYTSTAYLPLSGGALSGPLRFTGGEGVITPNTLISEINNYAGGTNQFKSSSIKFYTGTYVDQGKITFNTSVSGIDHVRLTLEETGVATFSSTVTATSYAATSLPVFENNAAASSLSVGQFYRTSTGVLMVKF